MFKEEKLSFFAPIKELKKLYVMYVVIYADYDKCDFQGGGKKAMD